MEISDIKANTVADDAQVLIRCLPKPGGGFDVDVKAEGVTGQDALAVLLLGVVEQITGVSTDLYTEVVDTVRRAARPAPGVSAR